MAFWESLSTELSARRRRLRTALGDWGQSLFELALIASLILGTFGLFLQPWMAGAAPWGFALPVLLPLGYVALDARRQRPLPEGADVEAARKTYDRLAFLWCALIIVAGIGAFAYALSAEPPAPPLPDPGWQPPEDTVAVDITE